MNNDFLSALARVYAAAYECSGSHGQRQINGRAAVADFLACMEANGIINRNPVN